MQKESLKINKLKWKSDLKLIKRDYYYIFGNYFVLYGHTLGARLYVSQKNKWTFI